MSSSPQTITKPPAERTFHAAVIVLSLVAAAQVIASGLALIPRIDFDKLGRSAPPHPAAAANAAPAAQEDTALLTQANALLDEGRKSRSENNFRGALQAVTEADRIAPNKPGILLQMASDHAMLGQNPEAAAILQRIVSLPPSADPQDMKYVAQAQAGLAQLASAGVKPAASATVASDAPAASAARSSENMRDDVGIPIGSVMGIVETKLLDAEPGQKNLRVSMKGASNQRIDPSKVHATVDFYEQDDHAQILHNDVPRPSEWLSAPVDWAEGDPEIFQVKYRMPLEDRGDLPPLQYYGYVVAIYYDGELQDQRADPPSLLNQYAPPLHKDPPSE